MKTFFYAALLALAPLAAAHAQAVPNGGLDTWVNRGGRQAPQGWLTTEDLAGSTFPISGAVVRSASPRTGAGAAELRTISLLGLLELPGTILLGTRISDDTTSIYNLPTGVPYTGRPARLEFYYKLTGSGAAADSALALIELTRTAGGTETVVAQGAQLLLTPRSTYTLASIPLVYTASGAPDSLRIGFSSGQGETITASTILTIDDVTLAGTATAVRDAAADAALSVFPTSSPTGRYTLAAPAQPAVLRSPLTVTDLTGRVVLRQPAPTSAADTRALELPSGLTAGLYTLRLETPNGPLTRKLVLE